MESTRWNERAMHRIVLIEESMRGSFDSRDRERKRLVELFIHTHRGNNGVCMGGHGWREGRRHTKRLVSIVEWPGSYGCMSIGRARRQKAEGRSGSVRSLQRHEESPVNRRQSGEDIPGVNRCSSNRTQPHCELFDHSYCLSCYYYFIFIF